MSIECTLDTNAEARQHELPSRGEAAGSPRGARSPLRPSLVENVGGNPHSSQKSEHSPLRRKMSIFAQSPNGPKTARTPKTPRTPKMGRMSLVSPDSSPSKAPGHELALQKQCAELYAQLTSRTTELRHVEEELALKNQAVEELTAKALAQDRLVRTFEDEQRKTADLHRQELRLYKESLEEHQRQNSRLKEKIEHEQRLAEHAAAEHDEKYSKLAKSFKALQSNYELEKSSRAMLIDQIEFLTKEREVLLETSAAQLSPAGQNFDMLSGSTKNDDSDSERSFVHHHMKDKFGSSAHFQDDSHPRSHHVLEHDLHPKSRQGPQNAAHDSKNNFNYSTHAENGLKQPSGAFEKDLGNSIPQDLACQNCTSPDLAYHGFASQDNNSQNSVPQNCAHTHGAGNLENVPRESGSSANASYANLHSDSDSDGSVHGTHLLSSFADLTNDHAFESSSPIKDNSQHSLELSQNFQFPAPGSIKNAPRLSLGAATMRPFSPPIPEEKNNTYKRQSLPAQLRLNSEDDFVLSPLKLTPHANSSYFDADADSSIPLSNTRPNSIIKKRYSGSRAHHSRYNSHDILPIKVEFESVSPQVRSASVPDKEHLQQLSSVAEGNPIEDSDLAFMKLNGFVGATKRDSLMTDSSKRSSFISDFNVSSGDITKQEITKLKFELQSLKLHNEKLLSYIGFELQKQKKNIKKLSSKQNLRPRKPAPSIEYSDAKLIERSKEMLIHKKRVLRSVSINPILSTKYGGRKSSATFQPLVGLGMANSSTEDEDDFVFNSHFISSLGKEGKEDCDDYGFLKHNDKYNSRRLSKKNQEYSEYHDEQTIKKYKSQTFGSPARHRVPDFSGGEDSYLSIDEEPEFEDGDFDPSCNELNENGCLGDDLRNGAGEFAKFEDFADFKDIRDFKNVGNFREVGNFGGIDECDEIEEIDSIGKQLLSNTESGEDWESSSERSLGSDIDYDKLNRFNQMKYLILGKEHMKKSKHAENLADENLKFKFLTIAIGIVIVGIKLTAHPQQQLTGN